MLFFNIFYCYLFILFKYSKDVVENVTIVIAFYGVFNINYMNYKYNNNRFNVIAGTNTIK
jgi:hypothetical protein